MAMNTNTFPTSTIFRLVEMIDYSEGGIVSKQITKNDSGNITLFAFDKNQGLSEHAAPFDAYVQVIEGTAEISINKVAYKLTEGSSIIMPANIPHAVHATEKFKMILTMIKGK